MAGKLLAFGDMHVPYQNETAVEIMRKVIIDEKPDIICMMGDMLDCGQFSQHPPTWGVPESDYEKDLEYVNYFIDFCQKYAKQRVIYLAGNHCQRVDRWAAKTSEGRGAYNLLAPHIQLSRGRSKFTYVKYGSVDGKYPHYKINQRIVAVHGWSYAQNAARRHLQMSQGKTVLFGHTHRMESVYNQNIWGKGSFQAKSCGCLCKQIPLYGIGNPVEWVNGFVMGYLGRHSDSLYSVDIKDKFCVLPSGKEIKA